MIPETEGGPFTVCDMVGNVSEWIDGFWDEDCSGQTQLIVAGGASHISHITRNYQTADVDSPGCWKWASYGLMRQGMHDHLDDLQGYGDDGFRCVSEPS
jgi:formylglycine-generating enzyme required for sulfatase activity